MVTYITRSHVIAQKCWIWCSCRHPSWGFSQRSCCFPDTGIFGKFPKRCSWPHLRLSLPLWICPVICSMAWEPATKQFYKDKVSLFINSLQPNYENSVLSHFLSSFFGQKSKQPDTIWKGNDSISLAFGGIVLVSTKFLPSLPNSIHSKEKDWCWHSWHTWHTLASPKKPKACGTSYSPVKYSKSLLAEKQPKYFATEETYAALHCSVKIWLQL